MKALIPVVLVVGAVVGWLAPDLSVPAEEVLVVDPSAQLQVAATAGPEWRAGEIALDRAPDGHFYAPVRVDTRDYRMLVDTGASMVALTGDDARDIGISWQPQALQPIVRGAGGTVMGVAIRLPEVVVGDLVARDVDAVIIPEGLPVSLLGQSFLSQVDNVAIVGDRLTLSN